MPWLNVANYQRSAFYSDASCSVPLSNELTNQYVTGFKSLFENQVPQTNFPCSYVVVDNVSTSKGILRSNDLLNMEEANPGMTCNVYKAFADPKNCNDRTNNGDKVNIMGAETPVFEKFLEFPTCALVAGYTSEYCPGDPPPPPPPHPPPPSNAKHACQT